MNRKEHRIYQYLSEPLRLMGLTVDELVLGSGGLLGCLFADSFLVKTGCGIVGIGGVFALKKFKKSVSGFSLGSFLHWYGGIMPGRPFAWPPSHKRFWLS
jgi:hypothetical protein